MKDLQQMDLIWVHSGLVRIEMRMYIGLSQQAREDVDIVEGKHYDHLKKKASKLKDFTIMRVFAAMPSVVIVFPNLEYLKFANVNLFTLSKIGYRIIKEMSRGSLSY